MKKIISSSIVFLMISNMILGSFATNNNIGYNKQIEIAETYLDLCESMGEQNHLAFEKLLTLYPSLEVVDSSVCYFDENGTVIPVTRASDPADINLFGDQLVYDNDYQTYIYFGYWEWVNYPVSDNNSPYDVVGFYTQNPDELYPLDYFIYGYNQFDQQKIAYNSVDGTSNGPIIKGEDTVWGAGFWFDDKIVRSGRMVVPLDYTSGSRVKVMMKYAHSWTEISITGVGGELSIDGKGFNVSWDSEVKHWPGVVTSPGVRMP